MTTTSTTAGPGSTRSPGSAGAVNLAHWVRERARTSPASVAVRQGEVELSYARLDAASAAFAGRLRDLGVQPGDAFWAAAERIA